MGVSVSATKPEITTEPATAMPNSLKSRPVLPWRKASGVKTATSEMVVAMTAKAISRVPFDGGGLGLLVQLFLMPEGVLQHDDRVVHHDADGQRQREQRQIVDREAEKVHHGERRDDRSRDGDGRDDRRAEVAQEDEDDDHDEDRRDDERVLAPPGWSA